MGSGFPNGVSIFQSLTSSQSPHLGWKTKAQNFLAVTSLLSRINLISSYNKIQNELNNAWKYTKMWTKPNYPKSITFCFGVSSNLSQGKSPTAEILGRYFFRTLLRENICVKFPLLGSFCCNKFEETPKQKVIDLSKF